MKRGENVQWGWREDMRWGWTCSGLRHELNVPENARLIQWRNAKRRHRRAVECNYACMVVAVHDD